jgi:hypothetical protein
MASPVPNNELTQFKTGEEQVEIARKGGIASGEAKRQKRTFKEAVQWLVNSDIKIKDGKIKNLFKENGIDISGLNPTQLATLGCWAGAIYGNANNFKTLMEVNGEIVEETPTFNPSIEEVEEIVDNSNLEKVLYEANKPE